MSSNNSDKTQTKKAVTPYERFFLAGGSAIISKTASAPIERVKLLIQNQAEMIKAGTLESRYTGIGNCFKRTYQKEGLFSFFRGNLPNVMRYFPTQSLNFVFKDMSQAIIPKPKDDCQMKKLAYYVCTGGIAGSLSLTLVYSLDFARTRLANDLKSSKKGGSRQYKGVVDVYRQTIKSDGPRGLYRGFLISCVGIFVYRGFYFGLHDTYMKSDLRNEKVKGNALIDFAAAYGITVLAGLKSYPIDTIRRRMMMTTGQAVQYKSSFDCAGQIIKSEGFFSLFRGAGANILRGLAGAGVLFLNDKITDLYLSFK